MNLNFLKSISPEDIKSLRQATLDNQDLQDVGVIMEDVRARGADAVREHAVRLGDLQPQDSIFIDPDRLQSAWQQLPQSQRELLQRTADRIEYFATAQRRCLTELTVGVPGGQAGHRLQPIQRVGCYAPGGRYPLPSTILMTCIPARVAGVKEIWLATPKPTEMTLATAYLAGVRSLLCVGGAQAIAALAYGCDEVPACDLIVGPGNRWVTAAKKYIAGSTAIDMLAGPSELAIVADQTAAPDLVAADLLAVTEHDSDALPILISTSQSLVNQVRLQLVEQLKDLSTAQTAQAALLNGVSIVTDGLDQTVEVCNSLAPEHVQLVVHDPDMLQKNLKNYGALFIGEKSAEVFGDYGVGPNHVLPTGGAARSTGGLSVMNFLKVQTWLRMDANSKDEQLIQDTTELARIEGLEAHARAAERRMAGNLIASEK